ncbi:MAG TPA: hypothetical protein DCE63_07935 [Eubacterium sp.]|nr:hypothetical protein [Eubacterium sp.]
MMKNLKLPVGIEDFQDIRRNGFYYIDKTGLIEQLLDSWEKVNLFTRPCRFGKSLNMSMLRYFFEIGTDMTLFNGLHIMQRKDFCDEYMGRFPVVFLTLKGVDGLTFEKATNKLIKIVALEAERFIFLKNSDKLTDNEKQRYCALVKMQDGKYVMDEDTLESALQTLSELLYRHYGQKVVILVDEYDVPLNKAYQNGYYKEMVSMIRSLFGEALKTNEFLQFAVLTGCLRVSRESIFTGLNNFKIFSITDARFDEQFGFTEDEVGKMLKDYHLEENLAEMKEWYDGYHFGDADIYCPWDVINRVDDLCDTPEAKPKCYWINSSGNALVKRFVSIANRTTQDEIEHLIAGEPIEKSVRLDLTYDEIDKSIDNIWSVLFTTGYLTQVGMTEQGAYKLVIPNKEVRTVYISQIQEWFKQKIADNTEQMAHFWKAIEDGNAEIIEQYLNQTLSNTISVFDTKAPEMEKENSYHTFLAGMLTGNTDWVVKSNVEAGEGFADIIIKPQNPDDGIIFELKCSKEASGLDKACERAIKQIGDRRYLEYLKNDGRHNMIFYGIAFYKKRCKVVVEKLN